MINFESIIKRSFTLIWKFKYLWLLGILSGGFSYGSGRSGYIFDNNSQQDYQKIRDLMPNNGTVAGLVRAEVKDAGRVLADFVGPRAFDNIYIWIVVAVLILALIAIMIYINLSARGALIRSVPLLDDGKKLDLREAWLLGHRVFWRRLSLALIWYFIIALPLLVLSIPVIVFAIYEINVAAIILGILFGLAYIVFAIYLALIWPVVERYLLLENKPADKAITAGLKYFNKNWQHFVLSYLIVFGFSIGFGVAIAVIVLVAALSIAGIGYLLYLVAHFLGIGFWILTGTATLAVLLAISGIISSFISSIYTLTYKDLKAKG